MCLVKMTHIIVLSCSCLKEIVKMIISNKLPQKKR